MQELKEKLANVNIIPCKTNSYDSHAQSDSQTDTMPGSQNTPTDIHSGTRYDTMSDSQNDALSYAYRYSYSGYKKFLPPGFRSGNIKNMIIAIIFYIIIAAITYHYTTMEYTGDNAHSDMIYVSILAFFIQIYAVVCFFNYLNIWHIMPLCRSNSAIIRFIGKVILYLIMTCVTFSLSVFAAMD